ncbi:hypothetical protein [Streptomyces paradoxus]|uniref:Uncharacterized protein n=1 Tax=Streptomyces paradoxus TaxID=66375 RepID=A0A7W9TEL8_9ACTN|nr:hypothetical protein [Streptomyces paradoxus]MBB6079283.1 hypothetical protein [Streptomyces paradoxus]
MPEAGALGEPGDGGLAVPMDTLDLDHCVSLPPLDDGVLNSGSVADVVHTASFVSGISDFLEPLAYLGTMVGEFTERASFGLAPVIAGIDLLVPRLPNIGEVVGKSLLDGLGDHNAVLSAVAGGQPQVLSLSQSGNSVWQSSAVDTLGLLDGLNPARAMLSLAEHDAFQPLGGVGELVRRSHVGLAQVLEGLPALVPPLPSPAKMAGALAPLARVTETLAPNGFTVPVGLLQMMQEILRTRPPLADFIGGHVADLFAGVRSVADSAKRLRPSVLAEARYAFDAYREGDTEPMKDFLRRCLRLWPVLEDPCQALAVAMFEGAWEHEADLTDDRSVRRVLSQYARQGWDFERDHQIRGFSIGYIPDGWEQRDTAPGPEDLVIPRLIPWAQQFETESVQYVVGRFNEQEQAVLRAWAENHPMPWTKAPALVQQDEAQGEHNRRKLKRVAKEWRRREINRRELP